MNRRDFLTFAGGVSAASILSTRMPLFASEQTVPYYVRGLGMLSVSDPDYLRVALPKAHHHRATLSAVPAGSERWTKPLKGHAKLAGVETNGGRMELRLPDVVHIREVYPSAKPRMEDSPTIISIPWTSVRSVSAATLTDDRWTFVRDDTGEEIVTFRPRKLAESLRIELDPTGIMTFNDGKISIPLSGVSEVATDFVPISDKVGDFRQHFRHYLDYVDTGDDTYLAVPQKIGRRNRRTHVPAPGNSFARVHPDPMCKIIILD